MESAAAARAGATLVREASRRVSKQALEVSEAAAKRIAELLSQREKQFIKLSVKTRGCSGMSYSMSYAGACVVVPPPCACLCDGHRAARAAHTHATVLSLLPADEKGKLDELVTAPGGVKILVDNKALMHVVGTRMDFVNDRLRCVLEW